MTTIELGNIGSKEQAEKLTLKLSGKTYMNFIVDYAIAAGNYPVSISTERPETTGVACLKSNRNFVGFEIDENYYQIATDRFGSEKGEEKRKEKDFTQNSLFGDGM